MTRKDVKETNSQFSGRSVDSEFLKQVDKWRNVLAGNIATRNELNQRDLNFAVQRTIDRIVFLRICEDRGIERYGSLAALCESSGVYSRLRTLIEQSEQRFNAGLFHFSSESERPGSDSELTSRLHVDDQPLRTIIQSLYYPDSPIEFSALGADILGRVYEQFLGQVISLKDDGGAIVREKPQVRKHGGVYYTPAYVVRYIVDRTLDACLQGNSPREVSQLKILDPACGAGSFLVEAYQRLLDWHQDWYVANDPSQHNEQVRQTRSRRWILTVKERKRILLDNIHGVDLDGQAVEVTKLSLLLKLLDGEDASVEDRQLRLFHEHALPGLECNIQCGNSLIQSDMPHSTTTGDEAVANRPFDYATRFTSVFGRKKAGFDVIVGNPPYISVRLLAQTLSDDVRDYLRKQYRCATGLYDMYVLFVERSYDLLRQNGRFGMIVPNKIAALNYARPCRDLLKRQTTIEEIADVSSLRVFGSVGVYPYLLFWQKAAPPTGHLVNVRLVHSIGQLRRGQTDSRVLQDRLSVDDGFAIHGWLDVESRVPTEPLSKLATIHSGTTGFSARQMADSLVEKGDFGSRECHDFIVSGNIDRYRVDLGNVRFQRKDYTRPVLPIDVDWLTENKRRLYGEEKLVVAGMTKRLEFALDSTGLALGVQVYAAARLQDDPHYLLSILNSKLISYLFRQRFAAKHLAGGYLAVNKGPIERIPIRRVDESQISDWKLKNRLIKLASQMIALQQQMSDAVTERQRSNLERKTTEKDRQIDDLVFELYGVTNEERTLIDGAMENI